MEICVLGSSSFVLGFRLVGIRKVEVTDEREFTECLTAALQDPETGILVLSDEDVARLSPAWKRRLSDSVRPVVISIGKAGEEDIRERIKRALGIDLYRNE